MRVFIFSQIVSEKFLILRRNGRGIIKNAYWASGEVPLFVSDFNELWIFRQILEKNIQISNFIKIHPMGAAFYANGRKDGHNEANSRFSQWCERA